MRPYLTEQGVTYVLLRISASGEPLVTITTIDSVSCKAPHALMERRLLDEALTKRPYGLIDADDSLRHVEIRL